MSGRPAAKRILIVSQSAGTPDHARGIFHYTTNLMRALECCGHRVTLLVEQTPFGGGSLDGIYAGLQRTEFAGQNGWRRLAARIAPLLSFRSVRLLLRRTVMLRGVAIANDRAAIPPALDHLRAVEEILACRSVYSIAVSGSIFGLGAATVDASGYDVVLVDSPTHLRFRKSPGADVVAVIHDLIPLSYPATDPRWKRIFLTSLRTSMAVADGFLFVSETTRKKFGESFPDAKKGTVLHPAVDDQSAHEAPAAASREGYFIVFISGEPRKNLDNLVRAFAFLPCEIRLKVLGFLPDRFHTASAIAARDAASGSLGEGRIELTGYVSAAEKKSMLEEAIGVVVPSFIEGFGIPIVEGAIAGKPVFCSDIAVFREVAGNHAFYFDPHSPESIAAAMMAYLHDPQKFEPRVAALERECRARFGMAGLVRAAGARFGAS